MAKLATYVYNVSVQLNSCLLVIESRRERIVDANIVNCEEVGAS